MGSVPFHPYLKECLDYYKTLHFIYESTFLSTHTCPYIMSNILKKYGYQFVNANQSIDLDIQVYDRTYFGHGWECPKKDYYAIHYFYGSWLNRRRGSLYNFCKKNDFMSFYLNVEHIRRFLTQSFWCVYKR